MPPFVPSNGAQRMAQDTQTPKPGLTRRAATRLGAAALAAPWVTTAARAAGQLNVVLNQGLLAKLWIDELNPVF